MKPKLNIASNSSKIAENSSTTRPLWISIIVSSFTGLQISIYYTSIWPYLKELDRSVSIEFLGWVIAACSFGQSIASPFFGYINQRTHSVIYPVMIGYSISTTGQLIYLVLPWFPTNSVKWVMFFARFVTGIGTGSLSVLRTYVSLASPPGLKMRYISYSTGFLVLGITAGPAIQAIFSPFGEYGTRFAGINLNMYSLPTLSMIVVLLFGIYLMAFHFQDDTSRFIFDSSESEFKVLPKFDKFAAFICIFNWTVCALLATIFEVIATPLTIAMYNWTNSQAVFYNGLLLICPCVISVTSYFLFGLTRIGQIDKRKLMLLGLTFFIIYLLIEYPWFFYTEPLDYIPENATTRDFGGCDRSFDWCATAVRVPFILYFISFLFNGMGFPLICAPGASLYSEILGPRKQGTMQGIYSASGSVMQFLGPIVATSLFKSTGYKYIILLQLIFATLATLLVLSYYRHMRPLQLKPKLGKSASYKNGIFYVL